MSELQNKIDHAIQTFRLFEKKDEPYYLCYSGGKDSDTIRILAELSGVNFELHNNHTTVDSPTTVYYIREVMKKYGDKGIIHYPERSMWQLIAGKMMPPTRIVRYCCAELKEKGGFGRRKVTGVRWAESSSRKNNQGRITIIGKTKETLKKAEEVKANFQLTNKGGWCLT